MRILGLAITAMLMTVLCAGAQAGDPPAKADGAISLSVDPSKDNQAAAVTKETVTTKKTVHSGGTAKHRKLAMHKKGYKAMIRRYERLAAVAKRHAHVTKSQVGFYIPLAKPGMTNRYDIAGWHRAKPSDLLHAAQPAPRKTLAKPNLAKPELVKEAVGTTPGGMWYVPSRHKGMGSRYDISQHNLTRGGPV